MINKYGLEGAGIPEITEFSLGLGILLAIGVFLGSMVLREADVALVHLANASLHTAQHITA